MSTNGVVILVFFTVWTIAEIHSFFRKTTRNLQEIALELISISLFLIGSGIWFFKDNCDNYLEDIENTILLIIPATPLTFLAARFKHAYTAFYGLVYLSAAIIKTAWPAREGRCGLTLLTVGAGLAIISLSIFSKALVRNTLINQQLNPLLGTFKR